jgi:hypothetical protein
MVFRQNKASFHEKEMEMEMEKEKEMEMEMRWRPEVYAWSRCT